MSGKHREAGFRKSRVLFVESELSLPRSLYRAVESMGAEIVGPVAFADDVSLLVRDMPTDGAILDGRMNAQERAAIKDILSCLDIPCVEVGADTLSDAVCYPMIFGTVLSGQDRRRGTTRPGPAPISRLAGRHGGTHAG